MKADILSTEGQKIREIELPECFSVEVREDIIKKVELTRKKQPYAPSPLAGKKASASGKIRHARRRWKTAYGHGISRVPRKIFWRRGDRFYWQGATIASTRGGRRAHPPKIERREKKINKKERLLALRSAIAATASLEFLKKKYETIGEFKDKPKLPKLPLIVESKILQLKTKEFFSVLKKILNKFYDIAIKSKKIRAGKGKSRGRRYKKNAGLLFVLSEEEKYKIRGIDIKRADKLNVYDLASGSPGRLVIYTENAIKSLENLGKKK